MGRRRINPIKPKELKRPDDMQLVEINGVIKDPWLSREEKLAILKDLIKDSNTSPLEKRSCIEAHSILAGDTKDSQIFVLRIEVMSDNEVKNAIESRITKPLVPPETK